jgi:mannose-1-phosphate guanylyltransferase
MRLRRDNWLLVLAAGGCGKLGHLTTDRQGRSVPKQFCSLNGGESLLQGSLGRARQLAPYRRICAVVDPDHEHYWRPMLTPLCDRNVIAQPCNRGTLNELLLGVLGILRRDPEARIVAWQADHHVLDEETLIDSVDRAAASLYRDREGLVGDRVLLLGMMADDTDDALSYIIPGAPLSHGIREVTRFAEMPTAVIARDLTGRGALYNSLILVAKGTSIIECIRERYAEIVDGLAACMATDASRQRATGDLLEFYRKLPVLNLSQVVGQGGETGFCVFAAPACGWTDLATPRRVSNALHRLWSSPHREPLVGGRRVPALLSLANRYAAFSQKD